jgi:hypothetical protein
VLHGFGVASDILRDPRVWCIEPRLEKVPLRERAKHQQRVNWQDVECTVEPQGHQVPLYLLEGKRLDDVG